MVEVCVDAAVPRYKKYPLAKLCLQHRCKSMSNMYLIYLVYFLKYKTSVCVCVTCVIYIHIMLNSLTEVRGNTCYLERL